MQPQLQKFLLVFALRVQKLTDFEVQGVGGGGVLILVSICVTDMFSIRSDTTKILSLRL